MMLTDCLFFSSILFCIGLTGIFINRKNIIILLMCIELILLSVNTNFIAFSSYTDNLSGQIFVLFVLAVAAVEAAVGLAILVMIFRQRQTINIEELNILKG